MWRDLGTAICLVLVIEGLLPFLSPGSWRGLMVQLVRTDDRSLRLAGLSSMLLGAGLLYLVR
ncbi:MAG TPA: DUF2065 domain-containing protein [Pseudomonadales bacterium]|nr:DUF2065 domain-containing protein [Pseudomonadales bacterium]